MSKANKLHQGNDDMPKIWAETIVAFQEYLWSHGKAEETINLYGISLKKFGEYYRETLKKPGPYLTRLQESDVRAYVDHLASERNLSASTVNRSISALRAFSHYILEKGWHRREIAKGLKGYLGKPLREPTRLSLSEVRRLAQAVDMKGWHGRRDHAIVQLLLHCGLEVKEVTRLLIRDVIFQGANSYVHVQDPRSGRERSVPLNNSAKRSVKRYLEVRGEASGEAPLFLSQQDQRISPKTVQYMIKKYLCAIGRSDLSVRHLRQHFALLLYEQSGCDLVSVQRILGHRNLLTTARYVQAMHDDVTDAMETLGKKIHPEDLELGDTQ